MARLTITLSEDMHRALKQASARRKKSIRQIIEESLEHYGIKTTSSARSILAQARKQGLSETEAMDLAVEETRAARRR